MSEATGRRQGIFRVVDSHFGVLVEHGVDDVDEGLVAVEQAVPAGEEVALQPALAQVLRQHLHDPSAACQVLVGGEDLRVPGALGHVEDGRQAVGVGLVGAHDPEVGLVGGHHVTQEPSQDAGRLGGRRAGGGHVHGVVAEVGQDERAEQLSAVGVRAGAHAQVAGGHRAEDLRGRAAVGAEQLLGAVGAHPLLQHRQVGGFSRTADSGTWWERQVLSTGRPSTSLGPVQPLGVRRMIIGWRPAAMSSKTASRVSAISLCMTAGSSPSTV